jgi:hypothetical protein
MPYLEDEEELEDPSQALAAAAPRPIIDPAEYKAAQEEEDRKLLYINLAKAANTFGSGMATPGQPVDQSFYSGLEKQVGAPTRRMMELGKSKASEQEMLQKYLLGKGKLDYFKDKQKQAKVAAKAKEQESAENFVTGIRGEYLKPTKTTQDMETYYKNVEKAAKGGTPASDISLTFALMKLYDPTSSVRESEVATVKEAGSVPEQLRNTYNKLVRGESLTPSQRLDFLKSAQDRLQSQYEAQNKTDEYYKNILASKPGSDPNLVIMKRGVDTTGAFGTKQKQLVPSAQSAQALPAWDNSKEKRLQELKQKLGK